MYNTYDDYEYDNRNWDFDTSYYQNDWYDRGNWDSDREYYEDFDTDWFD